MLRTFFFLRHFRFGDNSDDLQRHLEKLKGRWGKIATDRNFNVDAAASVLHELFPSVGTIVGHVGRSHGIRVQSVRGEREQIYLNRIHTGEIEADSVREQTVLARLQEANSSTAARDRLLEGIRQSPEFADLVRFFQKELRLLSEQQELDIVGQLLESTRAKCGAKAAIMSDELCGMEDWLARQGGELDTKRDWYVAELRASVPVSMTLTSHLLGRALENPSLAQFGGPAIIQACCERIAALSTGELVRSLDPETPHSLQWLFNHLYTQVSNHWGPVTRLLLAAMRESPNLTAYPAALIFVSDRREMTNARELFIDARVRAIFGDGARTYYSLIAQSATPAQISENHWAPFREAARLLAEDLG